MVIGQVKTWSDSDGWGFVVDEEGYEYFLHISKIRKGQIIRTGDMIKFDISEGDRGAEAEIGRASCRERV